MLQSGTYIAEGGAEALSSVLQLVEKELGVTRESPDLFVQSYRQFGVADAEDIRGRARTKAVAGDRRVFILSLPSITTEAQNALLKTLEEPVGETVFVLLSPAPYAFLPTIRSRAQVLSLSASRDTSSVDVSAFLASPVEKRLELLKPLYDHGEETRDVGGAITFLSSLEALLAKDLTKSGAREGLQAVYRARKYLTDKGSLLKSLLEHVALLVPKV